jgi:hypothetical protein
VSTQAELFKREQDRANGVVPKKKVVEKTTPGSNRGKGKEALMDELNVKRLRFNQTTDSNQ